jgi:hypothetical protein
MKKTISIILIALVGLLNAQTIPSSQVKFYVNFEGNGNDYTSQKTCSNTNTTFSTSYGKVGQGAHFDGTANLKYTPVGGSAFNYVGCFSYGFRTTQTTEAYLFGNTNSAGTPTSSSYNVKLNSDGTISCKTSKNSIPASSSSIAIITTTTALNDGNWHHIIYGRLNSTDAFSTLIIDSNVITTSALPLGTTLGGVGGVPFRIGQSGDCTSCGIFIGDIDELGIFTNLTATQWGYLYTCWVNGISPF